MFSAIDTEFFPWKSKKMDGVTYCTKCGMVANFTEKTGVHFVSLIFVVLPVSGKKKMIECPNCKSRYQVS